MLPSRSTYAATSRGAGSHLRSWALADTCAPRTRLVPTIPSHDLTPRRDHRRFGVLISTVVLRQCSEPTSGHPAAWHTSPLGLKAVTGRAALTSVAPTASSAAAKAPGTSSDLSSGVPPFVRATRKQAFPGYSHESAQCGDGPVPIHSHRSSLHLQLVRDLSGGHAVKRAPDDFPLRLRQSFRQLQDFVATVITGGLVTGFGHNILPVFPQQPLPPRALPDVLPGHVPHDAQQPRPEPFAVLRLTASSENLSASVLHDVLGRCRPLVGSSDVSVRNGQHRVPVVVDQASNP